LSQHLSAALVSDAGKPPRIYSEKREHHSFSVQQGVFTGKLHVVSVICTVMFHCVCSCSIKRAISALTGVAHSADLPVLRW